MSTVLTAALTSLLIPDHPSVPARVWRELAPKVAAREDVRAFAATFLAGEEAARVLERLDALDAYREELETLEDSGIRAVAWCDDCFPQRLLGRLGQKAPPLLFFGGESSLLQAEAIGIVGSRDVDEEGLDYTRSLAREAVRSGRAVVSGGARGVDQTAMMAAIEAGGCSIGYMADSLAKGLRSPIVREALEDGRLCLASPFVPTAGFNVANAMARNKLVYGHASATAVVSSAEGEGGTWAGALEALSLDLGPVLVRDVALPPGNRALIRKGGMALNQPEELEEALRRGSSLQGSLL